MKKMEGFQKGVNLGGWLSQFDRYDMQHFQTFITENDIREIQKLGFDHVRVPVDYNVLEDEEGVIRESGFLLLENCLNWCRAAGLHMLIDLHECYGYSFDPLKKDMDRRKFFYDEALQERFFCLWCEIARRFGPYPELVAFEPLNEVVCKDVAEAWNRIIARYVDEVRAIAPQSWLILGGVMYNHVSSVALLEPPKDERIAYNFHCYEPGVFTHQGAYWQEQMPADFRIAYPLPMEEYREAHFRVYGEKNSAVFQTGDVETGPVFFTSIFEPAIAHAQANGVPLYCGEYGVIDLADNTSKLNWLKDIHSAFEKYGIGHALWNYKQKDFGLVDESFREIRDDFIAIV